MRHIGLVAVSSPAGAPVGAPVGAPAGAPVGAPAGRRNIMKKEDE